MLTSWFSISVNYNRFKIKDLYIIAIGLLSFGTEGQRSAIALVTRRICADVWHLDKSGAEFAVGIDRSGQNSGP